MAVYQYDNLSRKLSLTLGNGTSTTFGGYDLASRLGTLAHDVAGTAQDISLSFQYTLASQLLTRSSNNALYDWLPTAASTAYVPSGLNQYTTVASATYGYDGRGNMTFDGTNTYTYDVENRLLTASGPTSVTLSYDTLGRLQQTMVGSTPTQYLYDGINLVAEYDGSGNVLRRYVHGPGTDDPVVWYEGSTLATRNHLHADERGSVIATTDNTGTGTIYTYGPYGEPNNNNWTGSRFRYTGQTAIPEAHLYYYKARIYSPTIGRFLQTDPIGTKDDLNLYTYVGNDPLDKTDPTGLVELELGLEAEAFVGGGIKLGGSVSFDTQTLEIGAKGTFGIGGGVSAGVGLIGSVSPSSTEPAQSTTTTSTSIVGSVNLGPLGVSREVPVTENGKSVIGQPGSTSGSATKEVATPKVVEGLKPQLKVGASVSVDYSAKKTSSAVANAVTAVKQAVEKAVQRIICPPNPMQKGSCGN